MTFAQHSVEQTQYSCRLPLTSKSGTAVLACCSLAAQLLEVQPFARTVIMQVRQQRIYLLLPEGDFVVVQGVRKSWVGNDRSVSDISTHSGLLEYRHQRCKTFSPSLRLRLLLCHWRAEQQPGRASKLKQTPWLKLCDWKVSSSIDKFCSKHSMTSAGRRLFKSGK